MWPSSLEAKLDVPLDVRRMYVGSPVIASAIRAWKGPGCQLHLGATITGHVLRVEARTKAHPEATLTVGFDRADCNGKRSVALPLVLYALVDKVDDPTQDDFASGFFGAFSSRAIRDLSTGQVVAPSPTDVSAGEEYAARQGIGDPELSSVTSGQVIGVSHLVLDVGKGLDGASVLSSTKENFRIGARAEIVLIAMTKIPSTKPGSKAHVAADISTDVAVTGASPAGSVETSPSASLPPPPPEPLDTTEICAAGTCSVADGSESVMGGPAVQGASRTVSLARFGYKPQGRVEMTEFGQESAVHYLSSQQILVTFDTHRLRSRSGWPPVERHAVRAVLLNAQTGAVERVVQWSVDGAGQYIWQDGPGRVLVHMGDALQEIGPDLKTEAVLPAPGELLWLTTSPSGERIAVGLIHERHTYDVHERIAELSSVPPEEDVELREMDRRGKVLVERAGSSETPMPVITDDGEIVVRKEKGERWRIAEQTSGGARVVVSVNSRCSPVVSAASAGAMFVVGCSGTGRWYRMLRMNGRTLIKGGASSQQIEQEVRASADGVYAVRVVDLVQSTIAGARFAEADLQDERVAVHRGSDGRQVMLAEVRGFPMAESNFAIAPDGQQVAVLTGVDVAVYGVKRK